MNNINLKTAQRIYGKCIPWIIEKNDLKIINNERVDLFLSIEEMNRTTFQHNKEVELSKLWNNHYYKVSKELWKKAQK